MQQPSSARRLPREQLLAELERARTLITDLEADRWQSHERLIDTLAEHLRDGFSLLSPDGVHLDVNPALCAMVGYEREELVGVGMPHPYWPRELQKQLGRDVRRSLEGEAGPSEAIFVRKDGERLPVLITPSVIRDEAGEPVCVFAIIRDISEQKRADESLCESEARYRSVVENAPVGMFQSTFGGQLVYVNPEYAAVFGYNSPAEMIEVVNRRGVAETIFAEPRLRRDFSQSARDAGGSWTAFETEYRRKDGSTFVGLAYLCERLDPSGGEAQFFGFVQDTTAARQAAKALERSARLLGHGESLAHLGSWEWDVASDICTVSEEWQRMHGLVGDRLSNDEIALTCHEDDRPAIGAAQADAAAGGRYRVDHRIVHPKTHQIRHLRTYGEPVFDPGGRLETVIGASLDVTERVMADEVLLEREERLRRALNDTVSALGATVALRDPYTADHQRRVAWLAGKIAERLGWSEEATGRLHTAALVHDVGKITVPAEILSKPMRLTELEFELVKAHSEAAYTILAPIAFGGPVADIVLQHHERLDGSGYPNGLRGDEILPGARVLAVADVVEAMITHRPYRPALSLEEALVEIGPESRGRFDVEAAEACRGLFEDEGFTLPE